MKIAGWFRRNRTLMAQAKDLSRQLQEAWDECEIISTSHVMALIEANDNLELAQNLTDQLHRVARERDEERDNRQAAEAALADVLEQLDNEEE